MSVEKFKNPHEYCNSDIGNIIKIMLK